MYFVITTTKGDALEIRSTTHPEEAQKLLKGRGVLVIAKDRKSLDAAYPEYAHATEVDDD